MAERIDTYFERILKAECGKVTKEEHDLLRSFFYYGYVYCFDDAVKNLPKEMEAHIQGKMRTLVIEEVEEFFRGKGLMDGISDDSGGV